MWVNVDDVVITDQYGGFFYECSCPCRVRPSEAGLRLRASTRVKIERCVNAELHPIADAVFVTWSVEYSCTYTGVDARSLSPASVVAFPKATLVSIRFWHAVEPQLQLQAAAHTRTIRNE